MKKIISVFKSGTHTDRYGKTREYTEQDLQEYVDTTKAYGAETIPIQFTHESGFPVDVQIKKTDLFVQKEIDPADGKVKTFVKGVVTGAVDKVKQLAANAGMTQISSAIDLVKKQFVHFALVKEGAIELPSAFSNESLSVFSMSTKIESEETMFESINAKLTELITLFSKNKEDKEMDASEVKKMIDESAKAQQAEYEKQRTADQAEFEKQKKEKDDKIKQLEAENENLKKAEFQKQQETLRAEFSAFVKKLVEDKKIFKADENKVIEIGMKLANAGEVQFSKDDKPVSAFEAFKEMLNNSKTGFETELAKGDGEKVEFQLPDGLKKEDIDPALYAAYVEEQKKRANKQ